MGEAADVSRRGGPGLDRAYPASAQLAVALPEDFAALGEHPSDSHQRIASLAGGWREIALALRMVADS